MDLKEQVYDASGKSSEASIAAPFSQSTGQLCGDGTTFEHFHHPLRSPGRSMSSLAVPPVSEPVLPLPSKGNEPGKLFGPKCSASSTRSGRESWSSSSRAETKNGRVKLRLIWRALGSVYPDFNDRLRVIALLIDAGEVSLLPTPCKSDGKRWPGSPDHPRLQRSRGLRLQEELGVRPGPEIVEWMMGFPIGWSDLKPLGMPLFPPSPSGSADAS